jgi:hypothetical protein
MWIQHWVVFQFVHPTFAVPHDLNLSSNSGMFKHGNYADFIRVAERDSNDANQNHETAVALYTIEKAIRFLGYIQGKVQKGNHFLV